MPIPTTRYPAPRLPVWQREGLPTTANAITRWMDQVPYPLVSAWCVVGVRQSCCRATRAHHPAHRTPLTRLVTGMMSARHDHGGCWHCMRYLLEVITRDHIITPTADTENGVSAAHAVVLLAGVDAVSWPGCTCDAGFGVQQPRSTVRTGRREALCVPVLIRHPGVGGISTGWKPTLRGVEDASWTTP